MQKSLLAPALVGPDADRDLGSPAAVGTKFRGPTTQVVGLKYGF